jgi:hypothetical protein
MRLFSFSAWIAFAAAACIVPAGRAEPTTLLKHPQDAQVNVAASPKFDARLLVVGGHPVSASILEANPAKDEILLSAGAEDGVRLGHAFQILAADSQECLAIAKVMELEKDRSIAKVVHLRKAAENARESLKGLTAVCSALQAAEKPRPIEIRLAKVVWQTESLENKIIRGLLESSGRDTQILIVQRD